MQLECDMRLLSGLTIISFMFVASACADNNDDGEAQLRALDSAYVAGWKLQGSKAQEAAIMPLLTEDALIMPGMGTDPSRGTDAIRQFWFPEGAPPTNTFEFQHTPSDITIDGDLGIINGRYILKFDYDGTTYHQEGNYLTVAERQANDDWLASKLIWNDRRISE